MGIDGAMASGIGAWGIRKSGARRVRGARRRVSPIAMERLERRDVPAFIVVHTVADGPGQVTQGNGVFDAPTLRAAVEFANGNAGSDTIVFDREIAGQTIQFTANDALQPTAYGGPTALVITDTLTVMGDDRRGITLNGMGQRRLLAVAANVELTLQNLTLTGGAAIGGNGGNGGNGGGGGAGLGGAIFASGALLSLTNCTLNANVAQGGNGGNATYIGANGGGGGGGGSSAFDGGAGSAGSGGGGGGGMYGAGSSSTSSTGGAGGLGQDGSTAPANGTGATGGGGGGGNSTFFVVHSGGPATATNAAGFGGGGGGSAGGGGLAGDGRGGQGGFGAGGGGGSSQGRGGPGGFGGGGGGTTEGAGGVSLYGGGQGGSSLKRVAGGGGGAGMGGAIFLVNGSVTLTNCTLTGNSAVGGQGGTGPSSGSAGQGIGGAVCGLGSTKITATSCTIYNNTGQQGQTVVVTYPGAARGASITLKNTVVAGTGVPRGPDVLAIGLKGARSAKISGVGNFLGRPGKTPRSALVGKGDPRLGTLADNGGTTPTILPLSGSKLINAGRTPRTGLPGTDQRGLPRLVGPRVDIGAVELS